MLSRHQCSQSVAVMNYIQIAAIVPSPAAQSTFVSPSVLGLSYACFLIYVVCSMFVVLLITGFGSLSLHLPIPLSLFGYVDGVFSFSYGLVGVEIIVICSGFLLHNKLPRRVLRLSFREICCIVIGGCYIQGVLCLPTRVNNLLDPVIVSVILIVWLVCKLMIICYKFGDGVLLEIYHPIFGLHFSGRWRNSEEWNLHAVRRMDQVWLFSISPCGGGFVSYYWKKNSSESDHAPTISSPV